MRKSRVAGIIMLTVSPVALLFQVWLLYVPNGINLLGYGAMSWEKFYFNYLMPSYLCILIFGVSGGILFSYSFLKR
jgi:di/tricarboxylate transporter